MTKSSSLQECLMGKLYKQVCSESEAEGLKGRGPNVAWGGLGNTGDEIYAKS